MCFCFLFLCACTCFFQGPPAKRQKIENFILRVSKPISKPEIHWCNWKGEPTEVVGPGPPPLLVSKAQALASPRDAMFRDPSRFVPGEIHNHVEQWRSFVPIQRKIVSCPWYLTELMHGVLLHLTRDSLRANHLTSRRRQQRPSQTVIPATSLRNSSRLPFLSGWLTDLLFFGEW